MNTNTYTHIIAAVPTTTIVASRSCTLSGVVINKVAASGVITIYDGDAATGDVIAIITSPGTLLHSQVSIDYKDIYLKKALTVVTSTAAQDITIIHR